MLRVDLYIPNICGSPNPPVPQNVTLFVNSLYSGNQVKMKPLGWTLIQSEWYPYRKGKFGHRDKHIEENHVETQGKKWTCD